MKPASHQTLVSGQFGPQAAAYLTSTVHAQGEDLAQVAARFAGQADARVLDLGCGAGHVAFHVAPSVREVVAVDLSPDMLQQVAAEATRRGLANIATECSPVERLPFPDESFDAVLSRYSAHHWHGFARGLREARRVLKPHGLAIFIDGMTPGQALLDTFLQGIELLRDPSHVRNYTETEWLQTLIRAGFAPGEVIHRRLPLDFTAWVTRMRTPDIHVQAIRSLQRGAPEEVVRHFEIQADGSFMLDTIQIEAIAD